MDEDIKAWLTRDPEVNKAAQEGKDIYTFIACKMFKMDYEHCIAVLRNPKLGNYRKINKIRIAVKWLVCSGYFGTIDYLDGLMFDLVECLKEE